MPSGYQARRRGTPGARMSDAQRGIVGHRTRLEDHGRTLGNAGTNRLRTRGKPSGARSPPLEGATALGRHHLGSGSRGPFGDSASYRRRPRRPRADTGRSDDSGDSDCRGERLLPGVRQRSGRPGRVRGGATQSFISHCANPKVEAVVVRFYPGPIRWGTVVCDDATPNFGAFFGGNEPDGEPGP